MCIKFGVDSSSRFPFRAGTHTDARKYNLNAYCKFVTVEDFRGIAISPVANLQMLGDLV